MVRISAEDFSEFINQEGVLGNILSTNAIWDPNYHLNNINQMNLCFGLNIMQVHSEEDMMGLLVNGLNAVNPLKEPFDRKLLICKDAVNDKMIVIGVIINDTTMKIVSRRQHHEFNGSLNQEVKIYDYSELWQSYLAKLMGNNDPTLYVQYAVTPACVNCQFN